MPVYLYLREQISQVLGISTAAINAVITTLEAILRGSTTLGDINAQAGSQYYAFTAEGRTAEAAGLVDYKICAIDSTWSGLLFTRRPVPILNLG